MRKQHLNFCILASMLGMMATGCSDENTEADTPIVPDEDGRITVTASAGMPQGGTNLRLAFGENVSANVLNITWDDSGETFSVLDGKTSTTPSTFTQTAIGEDKHNAIFTGEITAGSNDYYAVYPAINEETSVAVTSIPLDMNGQSGSGFDSKKTYMYATSGYNETSNALAFKFNHLTSILKVTMQFPTELSSSTQNMAIIPLTTRALSGGTVTNVTFTADGLKSKANVNLTTGEYTSTESGSLSLTAPLNLSTADQPSTTVYLYVLPGTLTNLKVTATGSDGMQYSAVISSSATVAAGTMYTATATMKKEETTFTVDTKVAEYTSSYDYNGLTMEIGTWNNDNTQQIRLGSATISNGKAAIPAYLSAYAGKQIWVCIPKVVKFFHTLTETEVNNKALDLPDKDKGSTLLETEKVGDKPYKNDWIVALYIGINKNGSTDTNATPIYWATGNLIAIKTNEANCSYTEAAFHIASAAETTTMESDSEKSLPTDMTYDGEENSNEYNDTTAGLDGYKACATGSRWDRFGWGDATGLMTALNYKKYASNHPDNGKGDSGNPVWITISGNPDYDIACKQLGGSWRLPGGGDDDNNGVGELRSLINDKTDFATGKGTVTYSCGESKNITNTLYFPITGDRNGLTIGSKTAGCYWSGVAKIPENKSDDTAQWRARGIYHNSDGKTHDGTDGFTRKSGRAIRPVTE